MSTSLHSHPQCFYSLRFQLHTYITCIFSTQQLHSNFVYSTTVALPNFLKHNIDVAYVARRASRITRRTPHTGSCGTYHAITQVLRHTHIHYPNNIDCSYFCWPPSRCSWRRHLRSTITTVLPTTHAAYTIRHNAPCQTNPSSLSCM